MSRARSAGVSPQRLRRQAMDQFRALLGFLTTSNRAVEEGTGLTNAQLFVLRCLATEPGISAGALARRMDARPNALSPVLHRLEAIGCVRRRPDPGDRRRVRLEVTDAGHRRLRDAPEPPAARLVAALRVVPLDHLEELTGTLEMILRRLGVQRTPGTLLFERDDA